MELDLEKLEQLAKVATPTPWVAHHDINGDIAPFIAGKTGWVLGEGFNPEHDSSYWVRPSFNDLEYIVASCNDVPKLIAELKAEREKVKELERQRDFFLKVLHDNSLCPNGGCFHDGSDMDEWDCTSYDNRECWITAAKEAGNE